MTRFGFFDLECRLDKIDKNGDPLKKLNIVIDWERFRPELEALRLKERKSNAGRKPSDAVMMFKILILQSLYNLSDDALGMQILDRLSFMHFLGLNIGQAVPDATTIWKFREMLTTAGIVKDLFKKFDTCLHANGFQAMKDQIIDLPLFPLPGSATAGKKISRAKKIPMPAEPEKMAETFLATKTM